MAGKIDRRQLMKRLAEAQANGVGNNFKDGRYRLCIKKLEVIDGFEGTRFQGTFIVVSAAPIPAVYLQGEKEGQLVNATPNPMGSSVDWLCMDLDKQDSAGPGNVRRFITELFNRKDISDQEYIETLAEMCDMDPETGAPLPQPMNPAEGMIIDMETVRKVTKKNKVEIVVCKWFPVPESSQNQDAFKAWMATVAATMATQQPQLPAGQAAA